jgi:hypothetical protein
MDEIPNISGFIYRIARHKVGDNAYYRIHECFYDENGRVVLWGESSPHGETVDADFGASGSDGQVMMG